jgi:hypothetical protein
LDPPSATSQFDGIATPTCPALEKGQWSFQKLKPMITLAIVATNCVTHTREIGQV